MIWLEYATIIGIKLPVILVGLYYFRYLFAPYRLVLLHTLLAICTELTGNAIVKIYHNYNIWVFNIFNMVGELGVMTWISFYFLRRTPAIKIILPFSLAVALIWTYGVFTEGINAFYTPFLLLKSIMLILTYAIVLYYSVFLRKGKLSLEPAFWLSLSVIIFFGGNMPYYGFYNYMLENYPQALKQLFHPIIWTLNYIRYPMIVVTIYLAGSQQKKLICL